MSAISYERTPFWQKGWFIALLLGSVAGGAVWWWHEGSSEPQSESTAPAATGGQVAGTASPLVDSPLLTPPEVAADGRPADFTPEEWSALKEAMASEANPEKEMARIVGYLRFQKGLAQWQAARKSPDVAQRQQLARGLLDHLPDRLTNGEVNAAEALMVAAILAEDADQTEEGRQALLEQVKVKLAAAAPKPDEEQQARDAALQAEYRRREAAIVADFRSRPDGMRDPAQLEEELEAARRAVYGSQ